MTDIKHADNTPEANPGKLCQASCEHDRDLPEGDLFTPLQIRGVKLRNRIVMSPMCQYSGHEGFATDWHLVHTGSRAAGGVALVVVEATAVTPTGRITPGCLGLWSDEHAEKLGQMAAFIKTQGAAAALQLAHAGRKASCDLPWRGGHSLALDMGGWETVGPSPLAFSDQHQTPRELDGAGIDRVVAEFVAAGKRAIKAGFDILEIHAAHGYLLHSFLSPLSNQRHDNYGGSLDNRMRLTLRVATELRRMMPESMPLFVRISATDWVDGGWDAEQSVALAKALNQCGVDLIDVSTGGSVPKAQIPVGPSYQVPFAERVRSEAKVMTGAVGMITEAKQANAIVTSGQADLIFLARELLREPYWALKAEAEFGANPTWPLAYGYAVKRHK